MFKKYQHVERFGSKTVQGIVAGDTYLFPKIDGTNGSIWVEQVGEFTIHAGSRNREVCFEEDNHGFFKWVNDSKNIKTFLFYYPHLRLYGEWLVVHSIKTYKKEALRKFYVFDVMDGDKYLHYDVYKKLLEAFNVDYIPCIKVIKNGTYESFIKELENTSFLIEEGKGKGEGIVIKNYDYTNPYGEQIWAKIVNSEFKELAAKEMGASTDSKPMTEQAIVDKYITSALVEKEYQKIILDADGWTSKCISRLLSTVFYCLITEEAWNFVTYYKNPVIDFKTLRFLTIQKIKEVKKELF